MPSWPSDPKMPEWHKEFTGAGSRLRTDKPPNNSSLPRRDLASSRADSLRALDLASPAQRLCRCRAGQITRAYISCWCSWILQPFPFIDFDSGVSSFQGDSVLRYDLTNW